MAYCSQCGARSDEGAKFCWKCGRALTGPVSVPAAPTKVGPSSAAPRKVNYAEMLKALGDEVPNQEYSRNCYANLGQTGDLLQEFVSASDAWYAFQSGIGPGTSVQEYKDDTDSLMRALSSIGDRLAKARIPGSFAALHSAAVAFVTQEMQSVRLQQEWRLRGDKKFDARVQRQGESVKRHKAKLDSLVRSYHATQGEMLCPQCNTWVRSDEKVCPRCKRDFLVASKLGLFYIHSDTIKIYLEPSADIILDVTHSSHSGDVPLGLGNPALLYVDQVIASSKPDAREATLREIAKIVADIESRLLSKQFTWPDLAQKPSVNMASLGQVTLHWVTRSADEPAFDVLSDVDPVGFEVEPIAHLILPALLKWVLVHDQRESRESFALILMWAYRERWCNSAFQKQPGSKWLNNIMAGVIKERAQ